MGDWYLTTFYQPNGSLTSSSGSLLTSDFFDDSSINGIEKGLSSAKAAGGVGADKKIIPNNICSPDFKWNWKCGTSNKEYSSKSTTPIYTDKSPRWFNPATASQDVVNTNNWNLKWSDFNVSNSKKNAPDTVFFDCITESRRCNIRLHLEDNGVLSIRRLIQNSDEDEILWKSHHIDASKSKIPSGAVEHYTYIPSSPDPSNVGKPRPFTTQELLSLPSEYSGVVSSDSSASVVYTMWGGGIGTGGGAITVTPDGIKQVGDKTFYMIDNDGTNLLKMIAVKRDGTRINKYKSGTAGSPAKINQFMAANWDASSSGVPVYTLTPPIDGVPAYNLRITYPTTSIGSSDINYKMNEVQNRGRSFIFANEKINKGQWLSSPTGTCRLVNTNNELAVEYYVSKCTQLKATDVSEFHVMDLEDNPEQIGRMGYVDGSGILHEWPTVDHNASVKFGSTYTGDRTHREKENVDKYTYFNGFILGANSRSQPLNTSTAIDMSGCEKWCTADALCGAYSFNNTPSDASKCKIISLPANGHLDISYNINGKYAVRSKKIVGAHASLPTDVYKTVSNTEWNRYKSSISNSGPAMQITDVGGLHEATLTQRNTYESFISDETSDAIAYNKEHNLDLNNTANTGVVSALNTGYNTMLGRYDAAVIGAQKTDNEIKSNLGVYKDVQKALYNIDPEVAKQLAAMEEDKRLQFNSIKTRYLLWRYIPYFIIIIVAIIFFLRYRSNKNNMAST